MICDNPSGPGPRPDTNDDEQIDQDDDHLEGKGDKSNGLYLGALKRDLLEYQFSEDDDGEVDGNLLLMTPSSFMFPTRGASQLVPSGSDRPDNGLPKKGRTETSP